MNYKAFIGIDPGQKGAIALLCGNEVEVFDWIDGPMMANQLLDLKVEYQIQLAAIERTNAMPGQGVTSMFTFGQNCGWWKGALDSMFIPFIEVRSQEWQKGVVPKKKSKSDKPSLLVARRLFPTVDLSLKKHDGRADALLIADWLRRTRG